MSPSKSSKQRKMMGIALSIKKGKALKSYSPEATKMAKTMTVKELELFASKPIVKKKGKK